MLLVVPIFLPIYLLLLVSRKCLGFVQHYENLLEKPERDELSKRSPIATAVPSGPVISNDEQVLDALKTTRVYRWWMKDEQMDSRVCNIALSRLAQSDEANKGVVAYRLLEYMLEQSEKRSEIKPDLFSLNYVLAALSKSPLPMAVLGAKLADDIFAKWEYCYQRGKVYDRADVISYTTLMSAHVRSGKMDRAEAIFQELKTNAAAMQKQCSDQTDETRATATLIKPNAVSYVTLMRGHAVVGNVQRVESLFHEMRDSNIVQPTAACFNELLYAYSKSKTPGRAEEFLRLWLEHEQNSHSDDDSTPENIKPDLYSYNIVIHSLVQNIGPGSITRAERLFHRMPKRNAVTYSTLVLGYCRQLSARVGVEATEKAFNQACEDPGVEVTRKFVTDLLFMLATIGNCKEMPIAAEHLVAASIQKKCIEPDIAMYNALLYCWSKSGDYEAASRARSILATIGKTPKLKPNLKTYTMVLDCFCKSRGNKAALEWAKSVIEKMERYGPAPNVHAYTAFIQNLSHSSLPNKAAEAFKVLQRMKRSDRPDAKPNIISYNSVLKAAEYSDPTSGVVTEEALKVACLTFDEIRTSSVTPNHVTYGSFLGVLGKLMPPASRHEIVGVVFRRACKEGQVSPLVLRKLKGAVDSPQQLLKLMEKYDEDSIPTSWKANVREEKARNIS